MCSPRILHLEDSSDDAFLIERILARTGLRPEVVVASTPVAYRAALSESKFDLVLSDSSVLGIDVLEALQEARRLYPTIPFICVSGSIDPRTRDAALAAGATAFVCKDSPSDIVSAVRMHVA